MRRIMTNISVSRLKSGEKLTQNVITALGGTLFYKDKLLSLRDVDVLKAFLIPSVSIKSLLEESAEKAEDSISTKEGLDSHSMFTVEYESMLQLLRKTMSMVNSGMSMPILEIRTQLETLIANIDQFSPLTFSPRSMNMSNIEYLYHNSIMVALTSYLLAKWHGLEQKDLMPIAIAGLFHDIGNVKVDESILNKPTKLTSIELEQMRKHTVEGYSLLKNVAAINEGVKLAALQHHEKIDGSGYPLGLKNEKIHIYAKIVAIADIFHAMTNKRAYKIAVSPYLVLEQLYSESFGKLEPSLVQTFINKVTQFTNGTLVRLSDNRIGEIVFSDRTHPTRPWVKVDGTIINLITDRKFFIQEVIKH